MKVNKAIVIGLNNIYFDFLEINSDIHRVELYLNRDNHIYITASISGTKVNYLKTVNIEVINKKTILFEII